MMIGNAGAVCDVCDRTRLVRAFCALMMERTYTQTF